MKGEIKMIDLTGKRALVTGASSGIGRKVAEAMIAAGAAVDILAEKDDILSVGEEIGAAAHVCDITDGTAVAALVARFPALNILVNNAGLERLTPLDPSELGQEDDADTVEAAFRRIIDINVTGTFMVTRDLLPKIPRGGAIVNTASLWAKTAPRWFSAYAASKHAVVGLTRVWARELGPRNIRVNAVCPGWVETEPALLSLDRLTAATGRDRDAVLEEIVDAQDLPGLMQPGDVAGLYVFLASDLAASITGQSINVDRGEFQG